MRPTTALDDNIIDLDAVLHPGTVFEHPRDVVSHPALSLSEKRAILASWASDASAIASCPSLRAPEGLKAPVTIDDILEVICALDGGPRNPRAASRCGCGPSNGPPPKNRRLQAPKSACSRTLGTLQSAARRANGTGDQAIGWHPRRIPRLHGFAAHRTLEAVHFPDCGHPLGPAIDRSAFAVPVLVGHVVAYAFRPALRSRRSQLATRGADRS